MNALDRFKNVSVGSAGRILDYKSKLNASGDFQKLFDMDAILNSWYNILVTQKGTMDHDPLFGSNLYKYVFEQCDETSQEGIKTEIIYSLSTYDDRAKIYDVEVIFYSNKKGFTVNIIAEYAGRKSNMKLSIDETTINNFNR